MTTYALRVLNKNGKEILIGGWPGNLPEGTKDKLVEKLVNAGFTIKGVYQFA